jgi:LemA protein
MMGIWIGVGVAVALFLLGYNTLVVKRNAVANAFASVDALLKKRYDLIPNLVACVQGYMKHEQTVLREVTELRGKAAGVAADRDEVLRLNAQLGGVLGNVRMLAEGYPDLKADRQFLQLQATLNEVEEQISAGRRAYNAAVKSLNDAVQMLPLNILAALFGFKAASFFEASGNERSTVPSASLSTPVPPKGGA